MFRLSTYSRTIKRFFSIVFIISIAATGIAQDIGARMRDNLFLYYGEHAQEKIKSNLLCTARANKNEVFIGEPVTISYKLYTALQSFSTVERMPAFNGFSVYEIKMKTGPVAEQVNGKWYNAYNVRTVQLYPGEAGTFKLEPATIKNTVTFQQSRLNNSGGAVLPEGYVPEDEIPGFTKMQYEYQSVSSQPVIRVLPLPEQGSPAGFLGAVGKFNIAAVCRETEVEKNGAVKVVYTLTGAGNFKMINELPVQRSAGFEIFDPVIREELNESAVPFSGKKTFEYTFSPVQEGKTNIPPVRFSYFDPATRSFQSITANGIPINVLPAGKASIPVQNGTPVVVKDDGRAFYLWYIIPGVAVLLLGLILWFRQKKKEPVVVEEPVTEDEDFWKIEPDYFKQSSKMTGEPGTITFYTVLNRELQTAMMMLLNLPAGTTSSIYERLHIKDPSLAETYQKLVQDLNRVIYAYAVPETEPALYLEKAKKITAAVKA